MDIQSLLPLVVILPFVGASVIGIVGFLSPIFRKQESLIGVLATSMVAIPFIIYLIAFLNFDGKPLNFDLFSWMETPDLKIRFSYELDQLSLLMGMIVTGVGSLIHLYSISYMHGDKGFYKYFLYLNLFIFAMTNLVLGDNLVVLFLGWEGVGACSYFLIGYWFTDMEKAKAAQKAFVANRIGDFALLTAMFLIYSTTGTLTFREFVYTGFDPVTLKMDLLISIYCSDWQISSDSFVCMVTRRYGRSYACFCFDSCRYNGNLWYLFDCKNELDVLQCS
ncbi:MAG: hypothetical protein KatS3mg035_0967 [Bacteroidia bacterium]|nr:MAG: hypothetical protein KatS3mg035_0967 [Bacteroidia bacterium]